ncbi:Calcium/proton exchanger CAX-like [Purpureocillium takamizusanense]|uniref:Calcium/proton exchanger CAX-like n=1 Tax=Purpureocillium takamizusanense TaxID=2060973 RepID=A0A9Q8V877_9HYPO|nr:Calcium/proton exchanger CAX-like [Purpureocillium takamizusanense]UNI15527.1 Calcium/proton exchanger CAX-like [Purpureocillium takamizusanense]
MSESASLAGGFVERAGPGTYGHALLRLHRLPGLLRDFCLSVNVLLLFVPLGFAAAAFGWNDVAIASFNFLAIIPLSGLVSDASDMIGDHLGDLVGGLVNATCGNTVELIVGIMAIAHDELQVAQSMMLGSILSDILLVQGFCIVVAARAKGVVCVNSAMVDSLSSLMLLAAMALALPTALTATLPNSGVDISKKILSFSRATVVVLLTIYAAYLYFQLKTHSALFTGHDDGVEEYEPIRGHASQKQRIDFAIGVIIGSILQIALFVLPVLIVVSWVMGPPLDLNFEVSQTYVLLFAVVLVNQVLHDKQYTYLHGVMFLCAYAVITMAFFTEPNN